MAKNKARHILHGVLDCLPIILIPIFMIYSQNHEINDNSITINESYWENTLLYQTSKPTNWNDLKLNTMYHSNNMRLDNINSNGDEQFKLLFFYIEEFSPSFDLDNYVDYSYIGEYTSLEGNYIYFEFDQDNMIINISNLNGYTAYQIIDSDLYIDFIECDFVIVDGLNDFMSFTQNYWDIDYIEESTFKLYNHVYHENTPVVYNDTDIMSQSFYCLYNSVDKYFNMGNVFGMQNLYTWFETNIFGGTASPSIYIVWNIVLYEFVMDLLFLLYGLFMFFIDLCKRLMEKPLNSIK